jgi:hypothetical protein
MYMNSLNKVADDYIPGVTPGLALRAKSELSNRLAEGKIKKDITDFSKPAFLELASQMYIKYQKAFAAGKSEREREKERGAVVGVLVLLRGKQCRC